jgi:hypothetical protein
VGGGVGATGALSSFIMFPSIIPSAAVAYNDRAAESLRSIVVT